MMARVGAEATRRRTVPLTVRIAAGLVIGLLIAAGVGVVGTVAWRDAHGVPHIEAATMDDLVEAQGYVVAQDRLWQMDMARRFAAGELAELLGPSVVEHDKLQRILQIRPTAEHLTATMPADQRRIFEDFARGVNAFITSHQNNLPAEFRLLGYKPRPWQPVAS